MSKKGFTQTDYIIAIGLFIGLFALVLLYLTNYLTTLKQGSEITILTSNAMSLMSVADFNETPAGWPEIQSNSSIMMLMHFSENSTANGGVKDSTTNGNNGTISGGAQYNISGARFGGAWSFSGVNALINISDSGSLDVTSNYTISAWIYLNNYSSAAATIASRVFPVPGGPRRKNRGFDWWPSSDIAGLNAKATWLSILCLTSWSPPMSSLDCLGFIT